jgi:GNAT superfamily N-acetyltransferase
MASHAVEIEGDWNGLRIKIATLEDQEAIQNHLKENFYRDEPVSNLLGYSEDFAEDWRQLWKSFLPQNLSLIVRDIETDKVAAVMLAQDCHEQAVVPNYDFASGKKIEVITKGIDQAEGDANIAHRFKVTRFADVLILSIDKDYRGRRLGQVLLQRGKDLAKLRGIPVVMAIFSSPFSWKAAVRVGFETVISFPFANMVDDDGEQYLPRCTPDQILTVGAVRLSAGQGEGSESENQV